MRVIKFNVIASNLALAGVACSFSLSEASAVAVTKVMAWRWIRALVKSFSYQNPSGWCLSGASTLTS